MNMKRYGLAILLLVVTALGYPNELARGVNAIEEVAVEEFPRELVDFVAYEGNPLFAGTGTDTWDRKIRERGYILRDVNTYHLWYTGYNDDRSDTKYLGYAMSPDGLTWTRYPGNPIFDESWVEDMCVVRQSDTYYMFAEGRHDITHMLTSADRIRWRDHGSLDVRYTNGKRLSPGPYGTPTVWVEGQTWYLYYERNDEGIWLATSTDCKVWTNVRDEPVIAKGPEPYDRHAVALNQIIKYKGRYYAYYHATGELPWRNWTTSVAVSRDLVHWKKYPNNPIVTGNKSSGILVHDGAEYRLYTMHPDVRVYFPKKRSGEKRSVVATGAKVEKLAGGFAFTEGPAADARGNVFFTDIPNNRIHKWSLDGKLSTFRENSGGANGLYFDKDGNLLACEGGGRRLVSIGQKGNVTVLADKYQGKKFNSLNDLWIDPKGGIYFTDPRYGNRDGMEQGGEHVYYLSADRKKLIRVIDDMVRPNGVIGTPDGRTLYVTDHGGRKTFAYKINWDSTLRGKKLIAPEGSDGMTIDNEGNIYLTTAGVAVYDKQGNKIEMIDVPERPANVCFGGRDNQTLFITARTSLYSIRMRVKGAEQKKKYEFEELTIGTIGAVVKTPSLIGKPLPELEKMGIEFPADASERMILVCLWDMQQRPSRNYIKELAKKADDLAEEDVVVACVQVADVDDKVVDKWVKENKIPFAIGKSTAEMGKSPFEWGVKSMPWLILTDRRHIVTKEGFALSDLNEQILQAGPESKFEQDIIKTSAGDLKITFIGHGTLMFAFDGKIIHVDPVSREADYTNMPKADLVLITHEHGDHLDPKVIKMLRIEGTDLVLTEACAQKTDGGVVMHNGDVKTIQGLRIEAVPAYNIVHKRSAGNPFHPKGRGNGYIITFGDKRVYVAGDTENTPEMKQLKNIDVAFLPMNLPYTMTPEMVADAAKAFKPKILYPYHYGQTDPNKLVDLLKDSKGIEVRIRDMR